MKRYADMTADQRREEYAAVRKAYEAQKALGLKLNMARGKPSTEQLDMVTREMAQLTRPEDYLAGGLDTRNYGELAGIPEARALFAEILGCRAEQVFVGGNASLQLMYDAISKAYTHGMLHSEKPWGKLETVKWLCPAPGYDRHFRICQSFGMELITVPMTEEGPDMDMVERLVRDPAVKGMWNVPKYSNPQGIIYSAETVQRLAAMRPAAPDFMLMWDNAYCIHELEGEFVPFPDILSLCRQAGNGDMVYEFASTSKITFPGAGVAVMACSEANMAHMLSLIGVQTIGYDKINQLRHVRYLKDRSHTLALMQRHAAVLAPKFREALLGHAEVRQTYKVSGVGTVAGCYVQDGKLQRKDCQVRLVRDGIVIHEGVLASLQRFKDSVKEVAAGYECGLSIEKFNDIKEGDIIEAFTMEEIPQ